MVGCIALGLAIGLVVALAVGAVCGAYHFFRSAGAEYQARKAIALTEGLSYALLSALFMVPAMMILACVLWRRR